MIVVKRTSSLKTSLALVLCLLICVAAAWSAKSTWLSGHPLNSISMFAAVGAICIAALALLNFGQSTKKRVVIVGTGARACVAWRELRTRQHKTSEFLGFFDERNPDQMTPDVIHRLLGDVSELPAYLLQNVVDEIVIAAPVRSCYDMIEKCVALAEVSGIAVSYMRDVLPNVGHTHGVDKRRMFRMLTNDPQGPNLSSIAKRVLDVVVSAGLLIVLSPLLLAIAIGVKLTSAGPVFFIQERAGYRRRSFPMIKFRSMVVNADGMLPLLESHNEAAGPLFILHSDPRMTPLGRFLRKTSLDELPQLFNVLAGQMSLVGPRPMSLRDLGLVSDTMMMRRFTVKPGMTGMWQVRGLSSASLLQWATLDAQYVDRWSMKLDIKILALTLPAVFRRSGTA